MEAEPKSGEYRLCSSTALKFLRKVNCAGSLLQIRFLLDYKREETFPLSGMLQAHNSRSVMTYMPFNEVRKKLNTGVTLLPKFTRRLRPNDFADRGNKFLADPECRMWCMGIFCIKSYLNQICKTHYTPQVTQAALKDHKLTDKDLFAWESGRIRCTWPEFSGASDPPDALEDRTITTKGTERVDTEANLRKVIESIVNYSHKCDNVMKVIEESLEFLRHKLSCIDFIYPYTRTKPLDDMKPSNALFECIEDILNALFEGTGLVFDLEDMTKTEYFTDIELFHQVNVRIQSDLFRKHVFPEEKSLQVDNCEQRAAPPKKFKLRSSQEGEYKKIREENYITTRPIVTLIVAKEGLKEFGGGYGVLQNCGIQVPKNIDLNRYMDDRSEETKTKLSRMCRLYHYRTTDDCVKVAMDRHSMYTLVFDYTFWQVNRLSSEPEFSKWGREEHLNRLAVANWNEDDFNQYPEMRLDKSRIFFNENKDPDVFLQVLCSVINSLFETIPELQDEGFLKRIMNRRIEDGPEESVVKLFNNRLQQTIKDRAPFFQEYHANYKKYHKPEMDREIEDLLEILPSRDINSCIITGNLSDSTQEAYQVEVDGYEFDLLLFPVRKRRRNGGDPASIRHCVIEFQHSVNVFRRLELCRSAAWMYDYGKMEYIDEYGNEQLKLFILRERAHGLKAQVFRNGRGNINEERTDHEHNKLVEEAMDDLERYCSIDDLEKESLADDTFPFLYVHYGDIGRSYGQQKIDNLRKRGIDIKPDFRIIDGRFAKLFGFVTDMRVNLLGGMQR